MTHTNTVIGSFGCESFESLAWHLAHCHWGLSSVPQGLVEELAKISTLTTAELQELRNTFANPKPV